MAREITTHYDGFGLNDKLHITCDDRDPKAGNASHRYLVRMESPDSKIADSTVVASIQYQHGPLTDPQSKPGVLDDVVLAILLDRYRGFQEGPYRCRENASILTHLEEARLWMRERAQVRHAQGVLGKNENHK